MRRFLENKIAFAAILSLFAIGFAWNTAQGITSHASRHLLVAPDGITTTAHGPTMPPDPWEGTVTIAHGPTMPPDPWEGTVTIAHGPTMPPDPWEGTIASA